MTTIKLCLSGATASATVDGPITHGMVGIRAEIQWDGAWNDLTKTMKIRCNDVCRTAIVAEDGTALVPYECLIAGQWLEIGMDGWDADGQLRNPSSWASCGMVKPSVAQVDAPEGAPPTPDALAKLQMLVGKAETAAGALAGAADAAANSASDADKSAKAAQEALDKTAEIAVNTPSIGANGNWFVWDADHDSYVDSGVRAVGNDGSDANVTAENIGKALGFTPADAEELNQIKDDLSDNAEADAETRRKLDYLWKLNQGISYQFETDETDAYQKAVPIGAKLVSIESFGGNTVVWNQVFNAKDYDGFKANGMAISVSGCTLKFNGTPTNDTYCIFQDGGKYKNPFINKNKYLISKNANRDYVSGYNGIILGTRVSSAYGNYDKGDEIFTADSSYKGTALRVCSGYDVDGLEISIFCINLTKAFGAGKEPTSTTDPRIAWIKQYVEKHNDYNNGLFVSADVDSIKYNNEISTEIPAPIRSLPGYGLSVGDMYNDIRRTETGWEYVQRVSFRDYQDGDTVTDGVTTYYVLENPVITDITDLMVDFPEYFNVEAGGTLTFGNAANLPVPSSVEYLISIAEVNG